MKTLFEFYSTPPLLLLIYYIKVIINFNKKFKIVPDDNFILKDD